jgi:hypothetical protein
MFSAAFSLLLAMKDSARRFTIGDLHFLIFPPRKFRPSFGRGFGQYHNGSLSLILNARRKVAFDLSLGVEFDRTADHHAIINLGLTNGVPERFWIRRLHSFVGVGGDQDCFESVADVKRVKAKLIFRILILERSIHHLG